MSDERYKIYFPELSNIHEDAEIGAGVVIHSHVWIGANVRIGERTKIQAFSFLPPGVTLGNDVFIGPRVTFTNDKRPPSGMLGWAETHVGSHASIGAGAVILPGITIGRRVTIGAGAVVTKDVPDGETWIGNPARPLKRG